MAQVKEKKDIKKNCIDVEKVFNDCLEISNRENVLKVMESSQSIKLNKKLQKFYSKHNSNVYQELIPIEQIKYRLTYRNSSVY